MRLALYEMETPPKMHRFGYGTGSNSLWYRWYLTQVRTRPSRDSHSANSPQGLHDLPVATMEERPHHEYQSPGRREESLSVAACPQPRGLVCMGSRSVRESAHRRQADLPLHRI